MHKYIIKKLTYGLLVMYGVVTLLFFIFNALPGDPARMMLGQRSDAAAIAAIKKELGTDKPLHTQYLLYLNDLSPISVHSDSEKSYWPLFSESYHGLRMFPVGKQNFLVLKWPYLRRSFVSKKRGYRNHCCCTSSNCCSRPGKYVVCHYYRGLYWGIRCHY